MDSFTHSEIKISIMNLLRTVILASGFWLSAFFLSACKDDSMSAGPIGEVEQGNSSKEDVQALGHDPARLETPLDDQQAKEETSSPDLFLENLLKLKGAEFDAEFAKGGDPVDTAKKLLSLAEPKKRISEFPHVSERRKGIAGLADNVLYYEETISEDRA